jgi:hypothetical protein
LDASGVSGLVIDKLSITSCAPPHNNSLDASGVSGLLIHNLSVAQSSAAASTQTLDDAIEGTMKLPSNDDLGAIIGSRDYLRTIIRGHQAVETMLDATISEALPKPHTLELARLSFGLKVDLAVALRIIPSESRACYVSINKIRNRFAHNPSAKFGRQDALNLYNVLSASQRFALNKTPSELPQPRLMLGYVIAVVVMELRATLTRLRDRKLEAEVLHEMVEETIATHSVPGSDGKHLADINKEIADRIEKKRPRD